MADDDDDDGGDIILTLFLEVFLIMVVEWVLSSFPNAWRLAKKDLKGKGRTDVSRRHDSRMMSWSESRDSG
jgi:hypothetical protein